MTRHVPYTATCCAALAVILAAATGSPTAIITAIAVFGLSVVITAAVAVRHAWRTRQLRKQYLAAREASPHPVILPPDTTPDLGTLTGCTWCKDTTVSAVPRECTCDTPCDGIAWCGLNIARRMHA